MKFDFFMLVSFDFWSFTKICGLAKFMSKATTDDTVSIFSHRLLLPTASFQYVLSQNVFAFSSAIWKAEFAG